MYSPFEREAMMVNQLEKLFNDETTPGKLLQHVRRKILGFSQERYAELAGISRRTLSDIEQDKETVSLTTLNRALKPIGLRAGLFPRQPAMLKKLLLQLAAEGEKSDNP